MTVNMGNASNRFNNKLGRMIIFNELIIGMLTPVISRAVRDNNCTISVQMNVAASMARNGAFQILRFSNLAIPTQIR
jgi:hypothetical protein